MSYIDGAVALLAGVAIAYIVGLYLHTILSRLDDTRWLWGVLLTVIGFVFTGGYFGTISFLRRLMESEVNLTVIIEASGLGLIAGGVTGLFLASRKQLSGILWWSAVVGLALLDVSFLVLLSYFQIAGVVTSLYFLVLVGVVAPATGFLLGYPSKKLFHLIPWSLFKEQSFLIVVCVMGFSLLMGLTFASSSFFQRIMQPANMPYYLIGSCFGLIAGAAGWGAPQRKWTLSQVENMLARSEALQPLSVRERALIIFNDFSKQERRALTDTEAMELDQALDARTRTSKGTGT